MFIGKLNRRITVQWPNKAQEQTFGSVSAQSWTDYASKWAALEDIQADETEVANQTKTIKQSKFTIRYDSSITTAMRIIHGGTIYNISAVTHDQKRWTFIVCKSTGHGVSNVMGIGGARLGGTGG